jgi:hypothetical protein
MVFHILTYRIRNLNIKGFQNSIIWSNNPAFEKAHYSIKLSNFSFQYLYFLYLYTIVSDDVAAVSSLQY